MRAEKREDLKAEVEPLAMLMKEVSGDDNGKLLQSNISECGGQQIMKESGVGRARTRLRRSLTLKWRLTSRSS